jgi:endonuclease/exonuclease/phosphatase family metal-dependent hydrolase
MDELISGGFGIGLRPLWSRDTIRVVSWNIERGLQFSGILDFLRSAEADLILLQEVDLNARRTQHRDVAYELAQSLQLNYVFGKEFQELSAGSNVPAYHGQATLSPWPLSNGRIIRFQSQSHFWEPRWYLPQLEIFQRRFGGRIALVSEALIGGQSVLTYNLHLESQGKDDLRLQQLREVLNDARHHTGSSVVIMAGDLNLDASNQDATGALHAAGFHDAVRLPEQPTTTAQSRFKRARCLDWIYVSGKVRSQGQVHNIVRASDHYPVSAAFSCQSFVICHEL